MAFLCGVFLWRVISVLLFWTASIERVDGRGSYECRSLRPRREVGVQADRHAASESGSRGSLVQVCGHRRLPRVHGDHGWVVSDTACGDSKVVGSAECAEVTGVTGERTHQGRGSKLGLTPRGMSGTKCRVWRRRSGPSNVQCWRIRVNIETCKLHFPMTRERGWRNGGAPAPPTLLCRLPPPPQQQQLHSR